MCGIESLDEWPNVKVRIIDPAKTKIYMGLS